MVEKVKANPDFSASAVNLCNPPEVEGLLRELQNQQTSVTQLKDRADAFIPDELKALIKGAEEKLAKLSTEIRKAIDVFGSYQDPDKGWYALKQLKKTKLYSASNFESCFPEYAAAVLVKSINVPVLEGLIKGNLLDEDGLRRAHIIEDKEAFAYVIR